MNQYFPNDQCMMLPNHVKVGHPFKTPDKIDQMGFNVRVQSGLTVSDCT